MVFENHEGGYTIFKNFLKIFENFFLLPKIRNKIFLKKNFKNFFSKIFYIFGKPGGGKRFF